MVPHWEQQWSGARYHRSAQMSHVSRKGKASGTCIRQRHLSVVRKGRVGSSHAVLLKITVAVGALRVRHLWLVRLCYAKVLIITADTVTVAL